MSALAEAPSQVQIAAVPAAEPANVVPIRPDVVVQQNTDPQSESTSSNTTSSSQQPDACKDCPLKGAGCDGCGNRQQNTWVRLDADSSLDSLDQRYKAPKTTLPLTRIDKPLEGKKQKVVIPLMRTSEPPRNKQSVANSNTAPLELERSIRAEVTATSFTDIAPITGTTTEALAVPHIPTPKPIEATPNTVIERAANMVTSKMPPAEAQAVMHVETIAVSQQSTPEPTQLSPSIVRRIDTQRGNTSETGHATVDSFIQPLEVIQDKSIRPQQPEQRTDAHVAIPGKKRDYRSTNKEVRGGEIAWENRPLTTSIDAKEPTPIASISAASDRQETYPILETIAEPAPQLATGVSEASPAGQTEQPAKIVQFPTERVSRSGEVISSQTPMAIIDFGEAKKALQATKVSNGNQQPDNIRSQTVDTKTTSLKPSIEAEADVPLQNDRIDTNPTTASPDSTDSQLPSNSSSPIDFSSIDKKKASTDQPPIEYETYGFDMPFVSPETRASSEVPEAEKNSLLVEKAVQILKKSIEQDESIEEQHETPASPAILKVNDRLLIAKVQESDNAMTNDDAAEESVDLSTTKELAIALSVAVSPNETAKPSEEKTSENAVIIRVTDRVAKNISAVRTALTDVSQGEEGNQAIRDKKEAPIILVAKNNLIILSKSEAARILTNYQEAIHPSVEEKIELSKHEKPHEDSAETSSLPVTDESITVYSFKQLPKTTEAFEHVKQNPLPEQVAIIIKDNRTIIGLSPENDEIDKDAEPVAISQSEDVIRAIEMIAAADEGNDAVAGKQEITMLITDELLELIEVTYKNTHSSFDSKDGDNQAQKHLIFFESENHTLRVALTTVLSLLEAIRQEQKAVDALLEKMQPTTQQSTFYGAPKENIPGTSMADAMPSQSSWFTLSIFNSLLTA